jgi:hypothetical protein
MVDMPPLSEDEFRLLAYMRGYVDHRAQHLDPNWVQQQLQLTPAQMRKAANGLARRGLVAFFEWKPSKAVLFFDPEIGEGPFMCDIAVTDRGWEYLRRQDA